MVSFEPESSFAEKHRSFQESHGTDSHRLLAASSLPQEAGLITRDLLGFQKTAGQDVGIQQNPHKQSLLFADTPQRSVFTISPTISPLPTSAPRGYFHFRAFTGCNFATGRPRLVTVIVPPVSSTSSNKARHLALNSVALAVRVFMISAYQVVI